MPFGGRIVGRKGRKLLCRNTHLSKSGVLHEATEARRLLVSASQNW